MCRCSFAIVHYRICLLPVCHHTTIDKLYVVSIRKHQKYSSLVLSCILFPIHCCSSDDESLGLSDRTGNTPQPQQDDMINWKHFPRYWPFVRGIHRWPVNSPHKGQWRGALMSSLIYTWTNDWVNPRHAGGLRRNRAYCDVTVMKIVTVPRV